MAKESPKLPRIKAKPEVARREIEKWLASHKGKNDKKK